MRYNFSALLAGVLASFFLPWNDPAPAQQAPPLTKPATEQIAAGTTAFALDLLQRLEEEQESPQPGNILVSPYSLYAALVMVAGGAGGETSAAMRRVLRQRGSGVDLEAFASFSASLTSASPGSRLVMDQSLWPAVGITLRPAFIRRLDTAFGTTVTPLDYIGNRQGAAAAINAWAAERTGGRIQALVSPGDLSPEMALVLVSTIWFKGDWDVPFDPEFTQPAPFFLDGGGTRTVPLMQRTGTYGMGPIPGGRMLEIPYAGEKASMLILLPDQRDGWEALQRQLTPKNLASWIAGLQDQRVQLVLPRFRMSHRADLKETLTRMGMGPAFTREADFTGISADAALAISRVVQAADLRVDEAGSEAAAATVVGMLVTGLSDEPIPVFRADHPFLLAIRDRGSGALLFLARLMDPV
jgi:serpin B